MRVQGCESMARPTSGLGEYCKHVGISRNIEGICSGLRTRIVAGGGSMLIADGGSQCRSDFSTANDAAAHVQRDGSDWESGRTAVISWGVRKVEGR